ncbi:hypothetical protein D3C75_1069910 [compost metagenome]
MMRGSRGAGSFSTTAMASFDFSRHSATISDRKPPRVAMVGASPRASPADIRMPVTMVLQRSTSACISAMSEVRSALALSSGIRFQSLRMTDSEAKGVPNSWAAPDASSPMRTMWSCSAACCRASAR